MNVCTCVCVKCKKRKILYRLLSTFTSKLCFLVRVSFVQHPKHTKELHIAWEREEITDFRNNWTVVHNIHTTCHKKSSMYYDLIEFTDILVCIISKKYIYTETNYTTYVCIRVHMCIVILDIYALHILWENQKNVINWYWKFCCKIVLKVPFSWRTYFITYNPNIK